VTTHPKRFWLGLLAVLVIALWLVRAILLPFVLGMAVGYHLDPLVGHLERRGMGHGGHDVRRRDLRILLLAPLLARQTIDLVTNLPAYAHTAYDRLSPLLHRLLATSGTSRVADLAATAGQRATELLGPITSGLIGRGLAVINLALLLAITPLVAFYLLRDWPKLLAEIDSWLPHEHADTIRAIDAVLAGFARGTAIVCATLAVYYAITLTVVGARVGSCDRAHGRRGLIRAVSGNPRRCECRGRHGRLPILAGLEPRRRRARRFAVGQLLNDYVLTPNLVGDKVRLHQWHRTRRRSGRKTSTSSTVQD